MTRSSEVKQFRKRDARLHDEDCWKLHHDCAMAKIERMEVATEGLARLARNAVDKVITQEKKDARRHPNKQPD